MAVVAALFLPLASSYGTEPSANLQQVQALAEAGKWKEAESALSGYMSGPTAGGEGLFWKALIEFQTGRYAASAVSAQDYLQQNPKSGQTRKILGLDLFMLGNTARAEEELERTVELLPGDADARYYLGRVYFTRSNLPAALAAFQALIKIDPKSVRGHNHLGQTHEALNQLETAQGDYEQAISIDRGSSKHSEWPYFNMGVLHLKAGRARAAIDYLQAALSVRADFSEAKVKLATALGAAGQTTEAVRLLENVVAEEPANADARYQLGRVYLKENQKIKAQEQFRVFESLRKK